MLVIGISCPENSAGYLKRDPSLANFLPIRSIRSAMVINMDFLCQYIVTDIKQTCLGQGLGVTITARKRTSKLVFTMKDLGHTRSLVIRCLVVKIEHLQEVTLENHAKHSVKQLSKFAK